MSALVLDAGVLIAIDASDALLAGPGDRVLTSDPGDLRRLCDAAGNKAVVVDC
jgi:NAD(P)H-hydrate repair Nnr-like enzyme with NAD(P)H-hydrate dehydratase domain